MNKAITEGLDLMPPAFQDGLDLWSSGDGTAGSTAYDTDPNGTLVASDADFGACLEIVAAEDPQRLRYMGETPILPGCYLEVTARVKLVSGPVPQVRVAAYAGDANGNAVTGIDLTGDPVTLSDYSRVYEVRAIVGSGKRTGVDMVWGTKPVYGHFGLDILSDPGAVVRIESIRVEDRTSAFYRKLMDWVDVRDYGAVGDGVTDDALAFETADAAAEGREVMVPAGTYFLNKNVTMLSPVRFEGTVTQPDNCRLVLRSNFDFPSYHEAFGDETLALEKGLQALLNFSDHDTFDLKGRQVNLTRPVDVAAATGVSAFYQRRVLRNGGLVAQDNGAWEPSVVTASAAFSSSDPQRLTGVSDVASIEVGSLVEGFGVGREVYVRAKDEAAQTLTLSLPLARAKGSQSYTFTRFRYMLDFSGMAVADGFTLDMVEFRGNTVGCGVMLPDDGKWWIIRDCWFFRAGLRGVTSIGEACQGLTLQGCEFNASDVALPVLERRSVAFNTNKNDVKIRDNRCINHRHFGIVAGAGNLVLGNHFWQQEAPDPGNRTAGMVFTRETPKTTFNGNYVDNQFVEFTNEHTAGAGSKSGLRFGNVSIVGNIFTANKVADWFRFLVWTPIGTGHRLDGISVIGNSFKLFDGAVIERVDAVDGSLGSFDFGETRDVEWTGNAYDKVTRHTRSPLSVRIEQGSAAETWSVSVSADLPFAAPPQSIGPVTAQGPLRSAGGGTVFAAPHAAPGGLLEEDQVKVTFPQAVRGTVDLEVRVDRPG